MNKRMLHEDLNLRSLFPPWMDRPRCSVVTACDNRKNRNTGLRARLTYYCKCRKNRAMTVSVSSKLGTSDTDQIKMLLRHKKVRTDPCYVDYLGFGDQRIPLEPMSDYSSDSDVQQHGHVADDRILSEPLICTASDCGGNDPLQFPSPMRTINARATDSPIPISDTPMGCTAARTRPTITPAQENTLRATINQLRKALADTQTVCQDMETRLPKKKRRSKPQVHGAQVNKLLINVQYLRRIGRKTEANKVLAELQTIGKDVHEDTVCTRILEASAFATRACTKNIMFRTRICAYFLCYAMLVGQ